MGIIIIYTLMFSVSINYKFNDTTDDAYDWIYERIPRDSTIATTLWAPLRYSPLQDKHAFVDGKLQNDIVISKRFNDIHTDDRTSITLCRDSQCNTYTTLTMFNPTDLWFTKYKPDYVILSSLATTGSDSPLRRPDIPGDYERSYYKRFYHCDSEYYTVAVFDRPYFTESWYTRLDPRFKSMYASPRIEILKRLETKVN